MGKISEVDFWTIGFGGIIYISLLAAIIVGLVKLIRYILKKRRKDKSE